MLLVSSENHVAGVPFQRSGNQIDRLGGVLGEHDLLRTRSTDQILNVFSGLLHMFVHLGGESFYMIHAGLEELAFVSSQINLDNFLHTGCTEQSRHADEVTADAVFGIAMGGAGQDTFLVLEK